MGCPVRGENKIPGAGRWVEFSSYEEYEYQRYDKQYGENRFLADLHLLR